MAYDIELTGFTNQQLIDIRDAFVATQGPVPEGMTQSRFTKLCVFRFIRNVVKGWKRGIHEDAIQAEQVQVDADYQEDIA